MFEVSEAKRWLLGGYNHGHVANLPAPRDGTWYVVPLEVALSQARRRPDVLVPSQAVHTADDTVIGYRSLAQPV